MPLGRLAAYYLIVQGLAGLMWWALLLLSPAVRNVLFPTTAGWLAGRTLLIADVAMFDFRTVGRLSGRTRAATSAWRLLG